MRLCKLFTVLLLVTFFVAGICYAAGPSGPGSPGDILGQAKYQFEAHKIFRLVHVAAGNNDADGIAAGSVVVWDDVLDDGVSVETTTTSGDGRIAGVLVTTVVSNDPTPSPNTRASDDAGLAANWGWLQTYGLYQDATASAGKAITVNDSICAGETAGSVASWNAAVSTTNSGILGCALDAANASATLDIFITCD